MSWWAGPAPRGAQALQRLKTRMGRALAVLVIANNAFNIFGSIMLGGYAAQVFHHQGIEGIALPLFSIGLTVLVILLGEILPKALGSRFALPVSLASASSVSLLLRLMLPMVLLLERLMPAITAENELTTDEEEIRLLARLGSQTGQIEADEAAMIAKVFQLNDLTARDLMVPRVSAPTLPGQAELASLEATLVATGASWWVVLGKKWMRCWGWPAAIACWPPLCRVWGTPRRPVLGAGGFRARDDPGRSPAHRLPPPQPDARVVVDEFGGFVGVIGSDVVLAVLAGWWRRPQPLEPAPATNSVVDLG
jgi:CBS domain containing-hemolysin-like protein